MTQLVFFYDTISVNAGFRSESISCETSKIATYTIILWSIDLLQLCRSQCQKTLLTQYTSLTTPNSLSILLSWYNSLAMFISWTLSRKKTVIQISVRVDYSKFPSVWLILTLETNWGDGLKAVTRPSKKTLIQVFNWRYVWKIVKMRW